MAGTRLGRYDIVRALAKGALTDLLLGRAGGMEGFERFVAIKRLRVEFARDPRCLEAFVNEARLAATLHHHNIVQVHDIDQDGGQPYFAMEYVHGIDLRTLLGRLAQKNQQLPLQHVVSIVACAAAALHHAHEQKGPDGTPLGIVHRDVTPANILLGYDGNVKVVDFGIAKAAIKRITTDVGVLKGSVPYMAPEQCAGKPVDRRTDVFALGIVLYELATVRRLFKGSSDFLTMSSIVNAAVPKPSQYRQDIPRELEIIMLKALAREPRLRFQTAGEMSIALDKVARSVGVGASTSALASYMRLQFGEQKEPWLLPPRAFDDTDTDLNDIDTTLVDFDGGASGLAPPPSESMHKKAIPRAISVAKDSPIVYARTVALTPPTEVNTTVDAPSRAPSPPADTLVDPGALVPNLSGDVDDTATEKIMRMDQVVRTAVRTPPPMPVAAADQPVVHAVKTRDPTQIVTPLPSKTYTVHPRAPARSRMPWLLGAGVALVAGAVAAIVWWPSAHLVAPVAAPVAAPSPTPPPTASPPASGMQMTMRDFERAQEPAKKPDEAPPPSQVKQPVVRPVDAPSAPKKAASKIAKPTTAKTAPAPKRTVAKPVAKRVEAKKPAPTTKPAKKKWNPDDLFLDGK